MAKSLARVDVELVKEAKAQALSLLKEAFKEARDRGTVPAASAGAAPAMPPLFPKGIELIHVKFEIGAGQAATLVIDIKVAGPKPPD